MLEVHTDARSFQYNKIPALALCTAGPTGYAATVRMMEPSNTLKLDKSVVNVAVDLVDCRRWELGNIDHEIVQKYGLGKQEERDPAQQSIFLRIVQMEVVMI